MAVYYYTKEIDPKRLELEIRDNATITIALDHIETLGTEISIFFKAELSLDEKEELDGLVTDHVNTPLPTEALKVTFDGAQTVNFDGTQSVNLAGFQNLSGHNYWKKGFIYTFDRTEGVATVYEKFSQNVLLSGGGYHCDGLVKSGDHVDMGIVDVDGLLGYGPYIPLATFVSTDYIWPDKMWEMRAEDAKLIPAGFYLSFSFHPADTVETDPVVIEVWYNLRTT